MEKTIRKIGNSQGIILSKMMLDAVGLNVGDIMKAHVKNGKIILEPAGTK